MTERLGRWATSKAQHEFETLRAGLEPDLWQALCDAGWRAPPTEADIETRYGRTHVFEWPGVGETIVLLHGVGTSSVMWVPVLGGLVGSHVYAIDTVGQPSRSVQRAPLPDREHVTAWLGEVLDGLSLTHPHVVGASYGGWIAFNLALRSPERVASLVLVEPALTKVRPYFWAHGMGVLAALAAPAPVRRRWLCRLHMQFLEDADPRVLRIARLGLLEYRGSVPPVVPVTEAEFAAVATPTLLLLGDKSELHRATRLAARAEANMPDVRVGLIARAGHSLPVDKAEEVAAQITEFVANARRTP